MTKLTGWKEITQHCNLSVNTIRKWVRLYNFPVVNVLGTVVSDTDLIDKWYRRQVETAKSEPKSAVF